MKKKNKLCFEIHWKKRPDDHYNATKKEANYWFQLGKTMMQSELQSSWDKNRNAAQKKIGGGK